MIEVAPILFIPILVLSAVAGTVAALAIGWWLERRPLPIRWIKCEYRFYIDRKELERRAMPEWMPTKDMIEAAKKRLEEKLVSDIYCGGRYSGPLRR